jgi:hypothetical protein
MPPTRHSCPQMDTHKRLRPVLQSKESIMSRRTARDLLHVLSLAAAGLALSGAARAEGSGLSAGEPAWDSSRLQARVGISTTLYGSSSLWQQHTGVVLGDYYFSRARLGGGDASFGFRATSGLLLGQRSALVLGTSSLASGSGVNLTLARQPRLNGPGSDLGVDAWSAMPYLGVGWSGSSLRGGWGVSADLGFAGRGSGSSGLRVGSNQPLDDLLRELRLSPMLHLGVSYAF